MILYHMNDLKSGLKVLFEKKPHVIEQVEFVKPGKGQVFSRIKLRKLLTGQLIEKTFRSTDTFLSADIIETMLMYIYTDHECWYFMNRNTFEQFFLDKSIIQDKFKWLVEQHDYLITLWNNIPILITLNHFVQLKVLSNISDYQSNITMSHNRYKLCKVSTGTLIKVPLFINVGDIIKIDTRNGLYISRVNI